MADQERVNHIQTIAAVALCAVATAIAIPLAGIILAWSWRVVDSSWFPQWWNVIAALGLRGLASVAGASIGLLITAAVLRRADVTIVSYGVGTIYFCVMAAFIAIIVYGGAIPDDILGSLAQFAGIIFGLLISREQITQGRP